MDFSLIAQSITVILCFSMDVEEILIIVIQKKVKAPNFIELHTVPTFKDCLSSHCMQYETNFLSADQTASQHL
jgi:hypothetical protein